MVLNWAEFDTQETKQPEKHGLSWEQYDKPQPPESEMSLWERFEKFANPSEEEVLERREQASGTVGALAGGLIRGAGMFPEMMARTGEDIVSLGKIPIELASAKIQGRLPEDIEEANPLSEAIKGATDWLARLVEPEEKGLPAKIAGKIGEYAVGTKLIADDIVRIGARLLKDPSKLSNNKIWRKIQEVAIGAAKDPKKADAIEQTISALMAITGQISKEMGATPNQQMVSELVTGVLSGSVPATRAGVMNLWKKHFPGTPRQMGKAEAAKYLQEVAAADPQFITRLDEGLRLQESTGIKMDLGELTNNPELKAALQAMDILDAGSATAVITKAQQQTQQLESAFPPSRTTQEAAAAQLQAWRQGVETELDQRIKNTISNLSDVVEDVAPIDRVTSGIQGREMLAGAKQEADDAVKAAYKEVGNPDVHIDQIKKGIRDARKADKMFGELEGQTLKNAKKFFGTKSKRISLDDLRDFQSHIGQKISEANLANNRNKTRIYTKIYVSIENQLDDHIARGVGDVNTLRIAKAKASEYHDIFSQGEVLLATREAAQGMDKISTDDFARIFIRPNSEAKTARIEESIRSFYNAYGKGVDARNYMSNAFGALMKDAIGDPPNPQKANLFLKRHSRFLKEAGISEKYSNVNKAIKEAQKADRTMVLDRQKFIQSQVGKFLKTDNPRKAMLAAVENGTVNKLFREVDKIPQSSRRESIKRGMKDALWEALYDKTFTGKVAGEQILHAAGAVRKILAVNKGTIQKALGKEHTQRLNDLLDVIDRIDPAFTTTAGIPKAHVDTQLVEKLMTGLRAAAHGFVRPDLIVAQMSMRGMKALTVKESHKFLKEAMENHKFAIELLKMNATIEGKQIVGTLFAPLMAESVRETQPDNRSQ